MIAIKIEDRKQFTSGLFVGDMFDSFLVKEASIVTFNAFTIDGRVRKGYYSKEEQEERKLEEYSFWSAVRTGGEGVCGRIWAVYCSGTD